MTNLEQHFTDKVVTQLDFNSKYIKLDDAIELAKEIENAYKEKQELSNNNGAKELQAMFDVQDLLKFFFTRKVLLLALLMLIVMNLDMIFFMFNYEFIWEAKAKLLFKIAFVIPLAIATSQTLNHAFRNFKNETEEGVPSPRTVIYYITQSWLLYVMLSTGLTIYNFNLESVGIENLSDFVATFNILTSLLALIQFIMWRWFRLYYNFIFSTLDDINDSNSTFNIITPSQKTYIAITLILGLLWTAKDIFIAFLSR